MKEKPTSLQCSAADQVLRLECLRFPIVQRPCSVGSAVPYSVALSISVYGAVEESKFVSQGKGLNSICLANLV